jgi:arginine decarboxylase
VAAGDGASSLALATRNTQALATRSFRQPSGDCNAKDGGNGDVPELVPPAFGAHTTRRLGYVALLLAQ